MAVNKPVGDKARKGAVRKRTQLQTKLQERKTWTKRDKTSGRFVDQRKAPAKKKFKGVRRESSAALSFDLVGSETVTDGGGADSPRHSPF